MGVLSALVLAAIAVLMSGVAAEIEVRGRVLQTWRLVLAYCLAGAVAGAGTGVLIPLARGRVMKVLVGFIIGVVAGVAIAVTLISGEGLGAVVAGSVGGGLLGGIVGATL
jgi:hypothetical protein